LQNNTAQLKRSDLSLVKDLAYRVWPVSYAVVITEHQINYMLDLMYSTKKLEKDFDEGQQFYGYFENEKLLGFITFENNHPSTRQMKIHKLYVDTHSTKKGIGNTLVDCAKDYAKKTDMNEIVLNVNRKNPAIMFYQKIDFVIDREEIIDIGEGFVMDDYIMKYILPC
jgi:ribosomal protein S18 acetylase RimI-like enzyme